MRVLFIRRERRSTSIEVLVVILSFLFALLFASIPLVIAGLDPIHVYFTVFKYGFGGRWEWIDTLTKATPLVFTGIACSLAFMAGMWNVGAEGQLFIGAWAATGVASFWLPPDTPPLVMLSIMMVAGFMAGAFYGLIPGLLRGFFNTNEILTSLMLVYVAVQWNNYFIYSPWSDRGFQLTPLFPESAHLPYLFSLPLSFYLVIPLSIAFYLLMKRSRSGFEWRVMGANLETARYAGIDVRKGMMMVMFLSGGLAGLAGVFEVSAVVHRLQENFSPGYGFIAILIAFLSKLNPLIVLLYSVLFGGLLVGIKEVQPSGISVMLEGVILLFLISGEFLVRYRVILRRNTDGDR